MKIKMQSFKRTAYIAAVLVLTLAGVLQAIVAEHAYAFPGGAQLVNREIRISSSAAGATGVTYLVAFQPATDYTVNGIIVDFCGGASATNPGSPIINDSACDIPNGFTISATPTVTTGGSVDLGDTPTYTGLPGTWAAASAAGTTSGQTLELTSVAGTALDDATKYAFTIDGVTNPTDVETFYARIITYTSDTEDVTTYTHAAADDGAATNEAQDYGGIALSVVDQITIQARVRESLTFCVASITLSGDCANASGNPPNLLLENSSEAIVDTTDVSEDSAFILASTNAQSGLVVRMKNEGTCVGLLRTGAGSCELHAIGETVGTTTNDLSAPITPDGLFGMYVIDSATTLAAQAPYNSVGDFAMDGTATGVGSTYGDIITQSTGVLDGIENELRFGARASNTTPAGLYSTTLILNATGTF